MSGRTLRVFAATAALTFASLAPAAAGLLDGGCCGVAPAPVNWGCASSGCAPLVHHFHYSHGCCAPVRWGCGSSCGHAHFSYGISRPYDVMPVHVVPQGPVYSRPLTGYTYPVSRFEEQSEYPYVPGYGTGYYHGHTMYRPYGYRHDWRSHRVAGWRHHGPRYGVGHRMHHHGYPLRVRGQVMPGATYR